MSVRLRTELSRTLPHLWCSGSLPRPQAVLRHLTDHPDLEIPASVLEEAVQETVARQVKAGISLVGDGEMSKPSYVSYVTTRLEGFGGSDRGPGVADLAEFPEFAKQQVGRQSVRERLLIFICRLR